MKTLALCMALALGAASAGAFAETAYWRVQADRLTVVSNASARRAEKIATQMQVFEAALRDLSDLDPDVALPPLTLYVLSQSDAQRVFLTEADRQKQNTRDIQIASKFLPGPNGHLAAIVDFSDVEAPLQSLLLLYAHEFMSFPAMVRHPLWQRIGVADLFNGVLAYTNGTLLLNRQGPYEPDIESKAATRYDLQALLDTPFQTIASTGDWKRYTRRAREWAQFGMLTTPQRRAHYRELATLMRQGMPAEAAVAQAFGAPLAQVAAEFEARKWLREAQFKMTVPAPLPAVPAAQRLEATELSALLQVLADRVAKGAGR